jgi:purine-binding chemotaxis protein CheW
MKRSITRKAPKAPQTLPPSGLAEDILGQGEGSAQPEQKFDTIYAFADSLQRRDSKESRQIEERLETWVTFALAGESFGLPVTHVQEILRVTQITRVPHTPHAVRGVTNMRGRVLPVVDLRVRLGLDAATIDVHSRVLVVTSRGRLLGLLVDAVQQVLRLDRDKVEPPPPDVMTTQSDYILGVYHQGDGLAILLDVDKVLVIHAAVSAIGR